MIFKDLFVVAIIAILLSCMPDNTPEPEVSYSTQLKQKEVERLEKSIDNYLTQCKIVEDRIIIKDSLKHKTDGK